MDLEELRRLLIDKGLISGHGYQCLPLSGGVSSEIYHVKDAEKSLVVKKALPQLKVRDDWKADINRNKTEQDYILYVGDLYPASVPEIVYCDRENDYFVMEFLGNSFKNWKNQLLGGDFNPQTAHDAALLLASIHSASYGDPRAMETFDTSVNFMNLRTEPYLLTTARRNPELGDLFRAEANRLQNHKECLVHGDFSPKNILTGTERLVLLDHEVAWYGDPAFDVAFMLTHLHLKQLVHHQSFMQLPDLPQIFWDTYFERYTNESGELKKRVNTLWPMLLLARVDGKSPVEYLEGEAGKQKLIRTFVYDALKSGPSARNELVLLWKQHLKKPV